MDEFARLQKIYADFRGFADMNVYNGEGGYWSIQLRITHFANGRIDWVEEVEWIHDSYHNKDDEAWNEANVADFIKKMDERIKANGAA